MRKDLIVSYISSVHLIFTTTKFIALQRINSVKCQCLLLDVANTPKIDKVKKYVQEKSKEVEMHVKVVQEELI